MLDYGLEIEEIEYLLQDSNLFNLSIKDGIQRVEHKQEVSKYQNTYSVLVANPVNAKIFFIKLKKTWSKPLGFLKF